MNRRDFVRVMIGGIAGLVAAKYLPAEKNRIKSSSTTKRMTNTGKDGFQGWHDLGTLTDVTFTRSADLDELKAYKTYIEPIFKARTWSGKMEVKWKDRNALLSRLNSLMAREWNPKVKSTRKQFGIG